MAPATGSRSVAEGLADRLATRGFAATITSKRTSKALRVVDMLWTVWTARRKYDVAHVDVYSGAAFRWAELVARLLRALRKPFVLTLHGGNLPRMLQAEQRRVARLLTSANAVTAPSHYMADAMRTARKDIQVIANPISLELYQFRVRNQPKPNIVWLRTFHRVYNPRLAIETLTRLVAYAPNAKLTMIGPDKDGSLAETRATATRLGVLDRIDFVGGVPKSRVPHSLGAADIFINTSTTDNAPVSIVEAMAMGLPVVSTNVGGIPYLIESEKSGLLVASEDADGMAKAVRRVLEEPGLSARLSVNARAAAEEFDWSKVVPLWEEVFTTIAFGQTGSIDA